MTIEAHDIKHLCLWLARELARVHAVNASLLAVVEEIRALDPRLACVDAAQIQKDAWQQFYSKIEDMNPEIAALIDSRTDEAF